MNKKFKDLTGKSDSELQTELHGVQRALFGLRTSISHQGTENTANLSKLRKEVARIKTMLRQRQIAPTGQEAATA